MTAEQVKKRYSFPDKLLEEYSSKYGGDFTDEDVKRLSLLLTLKESGFDSAQALVFLELEQSGDKRALNALLDKRRSQALEQVHRSQRQLDKIDYLKFEVMNK